MDCFTILKIKSSKFFKNSLDFFSFKDNYNGSQQQQQNRKPSTTWKSLTITSTCILWYGVSHRLGCAKHSSVDIEKDRIVDFNHFGYIFFQSEGKFEKITKL